MTKLDNDYYTYAYLREDKTPYYIGKGRGNRVYDKRRTIKPPADKSRILFLKKGLTEAEAFKHEIYMIFVLGRKDLGTGILRNRTNGGEGSSGHVQSEETKKKISKANSGKTRTETQNKANSERMIGKNVGKTRTEETKKKISEARSGVPKTEEWKKANSERNSGKKHPMYGRTGALSPCSKAMIAIEPDGTERHFGGVSEAARELEINRGSLWWYLKPGYVPKGKWEGWQFLFKNSENFNGKINH